MDIKNGAHAPAGSACLENVRAGLLDAMQSAFGRLDFWPDDDGTIHRFHVPGDRTGTRNGWYILFADGCACFGSWKSGENHTWSGGHSSTVDPARAEELRRLREEAKRQRAAELASRQDAAAATAQALWEHARRANPNHPYLTRKHIRAYALRQQGQALLVPLYYGGALVNLQRIWPDGGKRFLPGGRIRGCYSPLGIIKAGEPLYVCEGWATAATLHQYTGTAVAAAMNAGNLLRAGEHLRERYAACQLIVAGDDDRLTEGNPGRTAAIAAATVLGALVTFPAWPPEAPSALSDFNDLHCWRADQ